MFESLSEKVGNQGALKRVLVLTPCTRFWCTAADRLPHVVPRLFTFDFGTGSHGGSHAGREFTSSDRPWTCCLLASVSQVSGVIRPLSCLSSKLFIVIFQVLRNILQNIEIFILQSKIEHLVSKPQSKITGKHNRNKNRNISSNTRE